MPLSAEKLAEIDAQLDAFGKTEQELAAVARRATALATALAGDDEALTELLEGVGEAVREAHAAARAARPARPASRRPARTMTTSVGAPVPDPEPAVGSGLVEIPEEELRRADLPPVLDLGDADAYPSSAPPGELDRAFESGAGGDIQGLSVDELFEDAPPTEGANDLADLFSDPEIELDPVAPRPPPPRTMPPPVPPGALAARRPPRFEAPPVFPEEETDETMVGSLADLEAEDDSFEMLVDDDVLELDDVDGTEPPPSDDDGAPKGGLISRILGRK